MFSGVSDTYQKTNAVFNWFCYLPHISASFPVVPVARLLSLSLFFFFPPLQSFRIQTFQRLHASVTSKWLPPLSFPLPPQSRNSRWKLFGVSNSCTADSFLHPQSCNSCNSIYVVMIYIYIKDLLVLKFPQGSSNNPQYSIFPYFLFLVGSSFFQQKEVKIFCVNLVFRKSEYFRVLCCDSKIVLPSFISRVYNKVSAMI